MNDQKYLLLGHSGFIGKSIKNHFNHKGISINCLGRDTIDLENEESIKKLTDIISPNMNVIITAGVKRQLGDNAVNFGRNNKITRNISMALSKSPPSHLLYLSSAAVYGEDKTFVAPIDEKTNFDPGSYYAEAKTYAEEVIGNASIHCGFPVCFVRPPLVYGTGDKSKGYGPTGFCFSAFHNKTIEIWGDGTEKREFVWIEDLGSICFQLSVEKIEGPVNPVSGISHTFIEIIEILEKKMNRGLPRKHKERTKEKVDHVFSHRNACSIIKNFKFTPLEKGLETILFALEQNENKN